MASLGFKMLISILFIFMNQFSNSNNFQHLLSVKISMSKMISSNFSIFPSGFIVDECKLHVFSHICKNKANLRDLIAATGLVISNWIRIVNFSACVTMKFDWWPCKTIGHLFYATSSFVHHFVAIGEFKLELQSGNAQFRSNLTSFRAVRPWNLTDDHAKQ